MNRNPTKRLLGTLIAGVWMALGGAVAWARGGEPASPPTPGVIRQVDHILVAAPDARALFSLMAGTFQWPVAWPFTNYGNFASGGLSFGNVNLEILQAGSPKRGQEPPEARFTGFALEPEPLTTSLPAMRARGLRHGVPSPFRARRPDGTVEVRWTTVALPEVSTDSTEIFLCEYGEDVSARRRELQAQLRLRAGGPLTVTSLRDVVLGARDTNRLATPWGKLVGVPGVADSGVLPLGSGPRLRWVPSARDEIQGIVIEVRSLSEARRFLADRGLLGADSGRSVTLGGPPAQGLKITLEEAPPRPN